jgi:hypothetical protein
VSGDQAALFVARRNGEAVVGYDAPVSAPDPVKMARSSDPSSSGVDAGRVRRQDGLAALLGSPGLAQVMGADEELTVPLGAPVEVTICETCASGSISVYELALSESPSGVAP